jgi:hypothetical protein
MKRLLLCVFALALVMATPATAKGPSAAKITGPGIKGGSISLKASGGGDPMPGTPLGDLTESSGYFPALFGQVPDPMLHRRPAGDLGPKYTAEFTVPGRYGRTSIIRQDVYPYATPKPVTYTKPGQHFFDVERSKGGWYVAKPDLKTTLVDAGLPRTAPTASSGGGRIPSWGVLTTIAVALLLLALTFTFHRRRLGPAQA